VQVPAAVVRDPRHVRIPGASDPARTPGNPFQETPGLDPSGAHVWRAIRAAERCLARR